MHALLHWVPPILQQATMDPCICQRLLDTHRQVWVSLFWGHCSFLLGPGEHKVLIVPFKSLFPQSCVSSGGTMVGLMTTSSKRAYAIPRPAAPRPPTPVAVHCRLVSPQETLTHSNTGLSQSLWGAQGFVRALQASLVGMAFDSKHDFVSLTILLRLLLCPWTWGIFFWWDPTFSCRMFLPVGCDFGVLAGENERMSF